jgi:pilus assembly protein CpaB
MAAILPSGMCTISVEISPETGARGFVLPNAHVDVIRSRRDKMAEKSAGFEVPTSEVILYNVRGLAIDQTVEEKNANAWSSAKRQRSWRLTSQRRSRFRVFRRKR